MAFRIFKRLSELLDVDVTSTPPADGDRLIYNDGTGKWEPGVPASGSGAPDDATYLVATAHADLSAEVPVGATPGGELGGTWASPTVDATHSGSSHASVQAAAEATAAGELSTHAADTTSVHGIADTSALALTANVPSNATFNDHSARHEDGGADEISLAGLSGTPAALTTHEADTTSVHGIADTSALALTANVVTKALYDANTVLTADSDNTPAALTMGASTILARLAAGNIVAATPSQLRTLLDVPTTGEAVLDTLIVAKGDILAGTAADTIARVAVGATNGMVLEVASGATPGIQWDLPAGHEFDYVQITSNVSVTATAEGSANTVVTGNAVTYDGSTAVIIAFACTNIAVGSSGDVRLVLYEDGSSIGVLSIMSAGTQNPNVPVYTTRRLTPSSGSHTYSIRAFRTTANGTVGAGAGGSGASMPAYIRITKV